MKKIIITTLIILKSLTCFSQEQFEGIWISETSTFKKTIITSEYAVLKVFSFCFINNKVINENIISQSKKKFITNLYNKENGYSVKIKYKLKDDNTLICYFSGHLNKKITLTRYNKK
tara:strand:+ start:39 stop:389 length:351 start_codon:yes stop_codon:yes gene_type:complete